MYYVYILQSISHPTQYYTGMTSDLKTRIQQHNHGYVSHTSKFTPWKLLAYFALDSRDKAAKFEQYLKSGSGREFAKKHFR
ncbi:MAG: GIY-YIG nuclease family protein [Alphaproteobacteria bacterium]|nr:GIY-YIG nuclease family protein [Alphaproteobacteria bacterium]